LHFRLRGRLPQRNCQFGHGVHGNPGEVAGRFSKNVVVNFDPDTAGARATSALSAAGEEEFNIRVLTLETGFDPDLFIRRKGKDAYAAALKHSQKYFDYLIDRARAQFPRGMRTARSRPSTTFFRTFSACQIASCATNWRWKFRRSWGLIRRCSAGTEARRHHALGDAGESFGGNANHRRGARADPGAASATQMQSSGTRTTAREGTDEEFDPPARRNMRCNRSICTKDSPRSR